MTTEYNNVQLEFKPTGKQYKGVEVERTDETLLICSKKGQWNGYAFKTPAGESVAGFWISRDQELREGQQYRVVLQLGGMKSTGSRYQDVVSAIPVEGGETVSAPVSAPATKTTSGPSVPRNVGALKGMAFNNLTTMLASGLVAKHLGEKDELKLFKVWSSEYNRAKNGEELYPDGTDPDMPEDQPITDAEASRLYEHLEQHYQDTKAPEVEETVGDWTTKCIDIWKERHGIDESSQLKFKTWRTENVGDRSAYSNELEFWKAVHKKLTEE
jgi:hypothetical protein